MNKLGPILLKFQAALYEEFVSNCIESIYIGYRVMLSERLYGVDWVEDKLTAHLIDRIKKSGFLLGKNIHVIPQFPIYNPEITYGDGDPANAPVIDFKFGQIWRGKEVDFYAEAKNLSAKSWKKPEGATVSSSYYSNRYVKTGIIHYLNQYYPKGCLLAYIVNGQTTQVIDLVNNVISKKYTKKTGIIDKVGIIVKDIGAKWDICHYSSNQVDGEDFPLQHIMLQLA